MKKILVCVKMVPISHDVQMNSEFHMERSRVTQQLNISDMAALEAALLCKPEAEVTVLTMGTEKAVSVLEDLLIRGADRAVLLTDRKMAGSDSYATAAVIKYAVKKLGPFDLILCGRKAIDGETGQVPGELSAALRIPCVTNVSKVDFTKEKILCDRLLENGTVTLEVLPPAILSVCEYSYPLRLPSMKLRRQAAGKTVEILHLEDLEMSEEQCGQTGSKTKVLKTAKLETGLRKGPKETELSAGAEKVLSIIKEKQS